MRHRLRSPESARTNGWKLVTVAIMSIHRDGFGASNHQERHLCRRCAEDFDKWLKESGEKAVKKEEGATGGDR